VGGGEIDVTVSKRDARLFCSLEVLGLKEDKNLYIVGMGVLTHKSMI
jgi:hypothetical protein